MQCDAMSMQKRKLTKIKGDESRGVTHVRARGDMLLLAGSAPPCAGGRGTWGRACSRGRTSVDSSGAGGACVHHGAETNSKVADAPQSPTYAPSVGF